MFNIQEAVNKEQKKKTIVINQVLWEEISKTKLRKRCRTMEDAILAWKMQNA